MVLYVSIIITMGIMLITSNSKILQFIYLQFKKLQEQPSNILWC